MVDLCSPGCRLSHWNNMDHDTGPEEYFMHSMQCFCAQHEVFHAQHEMPFKGREPSRVFYNVQMASLTRLLLLLTHNPVRVWCGHACSVKWHVFTCSELPVTVIYGTMSFLITITQIAVNEDKALGEITVSDTFCPVFCFPTAQSVWFSCSLSISAKLMFQWLLTRIRSGKFSSIRSSSCSLWVANIVQVSYLLLLFYYGKKT